MKQVTMNLTSNKIMNKPELIKYYDYLNEHKMKVFNSFYKLKNNRELKLSILFDSVNDDKFDFVVSEIDKIILNINQISDKSGELIKDGNLNAIKCQLELYGERLDSSIAYYEYLNKELENLINT